ncbi:MAG: flagellar biosynthesis protein FlhB [Acidobacteriota bacterium]
MSGRSDRTEKATPKRRRDARKKGQIPRSKELPFAALFLAIVIASGLSRSYFDGFRDLFLVLGQAPVTGDFDAAVATRLFTTAAWNLLALAGPPIALICTASVAVLFLQGGFVFSSESLKPSIERLNPAANVRRVFSTRSLVELVKSLALILIVTYAGWSVVQNHRGELQMMASMDVRAMVSAAGAIVYEVNLKIAVCLILLAAADFAFQWYKHEQDLKMTKQEVKEDLKDTDGHPLVKSRIRRLQREMSLRRMMAALKEADVVVTNPTHFAVALKFEMGKMAAPVVVAKGKDLLAERIKSVAGEHQIPIVENPELARALYSSADIGEEVPVELYRAVAQILAYVYSLKRTAYR